MEVQHITDRLISVLPGKPAPSTGAADFAAILDRQVESGQSHQHRNSQARGLKPDSGSTLKRSAKPVPTHDVREKPQGSNSPISQIDNPSPNRDVQSENNSTTSDGQSDTSGDRSHQKDAAVPSMPEGKQSDELKGPDSPENTKMCQSSAVTAAPAQSTAVDDTASSDSDLPIDSGVGGLVPILPENIASAGQQEIAPAALDSAPVASGDTSSQAGSESQNTGDDTLPKLVLGSPMAELALTVPEIAPGIGSGSNVAFPPAITSPIVQSAIMASAASHSEVAAEFMESGFALPQAGRAGAQAGDAPKINKIEMPVRPGSAAKPETGNREQPPIITNAQTIMALRSPASTIMPTPQGLALGEGYWDGSSPFGTSESPALPGWSLHLAQGAAGKRQEFIAALNQHLRNLPAHEQISIHMQRALRQGAGQVTIQLSPADLGHIRVRMEFDEEKQLAASITVERPGTLDLLQRDAKALVRALQDAGLKLDTNGMSFSLGHEGTQTSGGQEATAGRSAGASVDVGLPDPAIAAETELVDIASGLLNVRV